MATPRTGSLESLRERNRMRVIDALRQRGAVSRADIARRTGLSRSTVSSLVADLQAAGLVVEREAEPAPRGPEGGRPPVLIALDQSAGAIVGIDFGHRHVRVAVADLSFTVMAEDAESIDVDTAGHEALDLAAGLTERLLDEAGVDRDRVLAAGMGLPAPIDRATGFLQSRAIIPSLDGIDPAAEMGIRLRMPIHLDNDANVGALGESTFGAGAGAEVMAYLRLSAGIGAGLVIGGRPFRGARGVAGEIGHVLVDPQGPICRCGNRGCLETFVAGPALCELLRRSHGPLTVPQLLALAAEGDAGCRRVIARRGPRRRPRRGRPVQLHQPRPRGRGRRPRRGRRPAARPDARRGPPLRRPGGDGERPRSPPGSSASAPRRSAPWPWPATRPRTRSPCPHTPCPITGGGT